MKDDQLRRQACEAFKAAGLPGLIELARKDSTKALKLLASIRDDERVDAGVRLEAAKALTEIALGPPPTLRLPSRAKRKTLHT